MKPISLLLHSRKFRILAALAGILILLTALCLYRACFQPLAQGITIGGMVAGGMTPIQARDALEQALEDTLYSQNLTLELPQEALTLSPEECKAKVRIGRALFAARHAKASEAISLEPWITMDADFIRSTLENYAAKYDTLLTQPTVVAAGDAPDLSTEHFQPERDGQTLVLTMGTPELHLDVDRLLSEIQKAFSQAIPLCRSQNYRIVPDVLPEVLPEMPDAAAIVREYSAEPVNDAIDRDSFEIIYGTYGTAIDEASLTEAIQNAGYGETIQIPIQYLPPEIHGQDVYFQDVLGYCETRHNNNENRNHNLQLQCDALNGLVLQPGETFSMNGTLGERTKERGYRPAPAYSGNRLVDSPGGGVCQGSTTLYNCVLLADLEVLERVCHGARVGYVPLGLDAAINWLTTDFRFRNNWNFPIQIQAWMEDGYMKMQILGIDEKDYYIKMETGTGEDDFAYYARSFKCKYSKETDEQISRNVEAYSTYYKDIE